MASKRLAQTVLRCTSSTPARLAVTATSRTTFIHTQPQLRPQHHRHIHTTRATLLEAVPTTSTTTTSSNAAEAITTPKAQPPPDQDPEPNKHSAYLGEADSDDGFEAYKDAHGDPPPSLDASNSAYLGEADSDDGFESRKDVDGEKLEAVDATNSAYLGEADSDDGFVAHRDAHPEEGDHKIENPEESGLHGQAGEQDR